jgi:acetate kinase
MILVVNSGSSSVKYAMVDPVGTAVRRGEVERVDDHQAALAEVFDALGESVAGVRAVGHRVVHGSDRFVEPTVVDDAVLAAIRELVPLAPLHNPGGIAAIEAARQALATVPHIAVFDTAFHAGLPAHAATYAIDREVAARYRIRRYGFHGISHRYVAAETARLLDRPVTTVNLIVLHLGNGASATAIHNGHSVETSMGFTPLEGLVMGTRTGDLDPAVPGYLQRAGWAAADVEELLQHRSGLRGLCGDHDMRDILQRRGAGDPAATLAFDVYCHRIRKYVGAYHAVLGTVDAIAFTAGVGEHAPEVRAASLAGLHAWGIDVDDNRNSSGTGTRLISPDGARVTVCVVPTDEETAIAREVAGLLDG